MRNQNALSVFIYVLVAELFFYFVASVSAGSLFGGYVDLFFAAAFCVTLMGVLAASFKQTGRKIRLFYYLLWIVSLIFVYLYIFHSGTVMPVLKYYFVLAVLIALLLSILGHRGQRIQKRYVVVGTNAAELERQRRLAEKVEYLNALKERGRQLEDLKAYTESLRAVKEKYQLDSEDKLLKLAQTREELDRLGRETEIVGKRLADGMRYKQELVRKEGMLADKSKKMEEVRIRLSELQKKNDALKKVLGKAVNEAERQAGLKQKYSKTLNNIHKAKKEEESLLVVSPDGKSVHRPACIAVRNISKENRKLIPSWKEAKKLDYKGCKLCKPYVENDFVMRNGSKFRFVVSRDSDKLHKTNCTVLKSIADKDKQYFKSYKQAVKKGYTPCRVCNPKQ
jgi:hypothetical protein